LTHFLCITARAALAAALVSSVTLPAVAQNKPYKGGELFSQQAVLYGRMEMRMRMARGSGILSTFFTYKNGSEGAQTFWEEIDIEVFGKEDATVWQSNIITGLGTRVTTEAEHTHPTSLADGYHTYALAWTPDYVAWELDDNEIRRVESSQVADLTNPQSLRFNLWAANIVEWVGDFDTSALPQYQYVNWISYSSYENGQFVHEWTDDFNSLDTARWGRADWTFAENLVDFDPNNVVVTDGTLVLALTHQGMTGFSGSVPVDPGPTDPGTGGQDGGSGGTGVGSTTGGSGGQGAGGSSAGGAGSSSGGVPSVGGQANAPAGGSDSGNPEPGGDTTTGGGNGQATGGQSPDLGFDAGGGCGCRSAPGPLGARGAFISVAVLWAALRRRRKSLQPGASGKPANLTHRKAVVSESAQARKPG
jgi:endo-1,3-1,4-beta-glycanase ExoK